MRSILCVLSFVLAAFPSIAGQATGTQASAEAGGYAGSLSCKKCHEKFYSLWSTSRHGLAMQPYDEAFAKANLTPQPEPVTIGASRYAVDLARGAVVETRGKDTTVHPIRHVLGGKNVYYLLTPMDRGRLQTLPLAYDVASRTWFDTAASAVRHAQGDRAGAPLDWRDPAFTFNTSCHNCHVSQYSNNYDLKTNTYTTTWNEPGINCETCHGPSAEHNRVMEAAPPGKPPKDMKILSVKAFTPQQHNDTCSGCHAKMSPVTAEYVPAEPFFDHFDLTTLEDPDFYPDGRDLGENYTYTSWLMSPCAKAGTINCVTCHTSSGRYRFRDPATANNACMPCHADHVNNAAAHSRHKQDGPAGACVSCHMPTTSFARMKRTDHSMIPPTPAATMAYGSPNACTLCHADKDAAWADGYVRAWRTRDYQAPLLARASLIDAARKRDWSRLPDMIAYIGSKDRDEVFATSLVRLIPASEDPRAAQALLAALRDPSPLVRGAAATSLQAFPSPEAAQALAAAASDTFRLVRVRAAVSLAAYPDTAVPASAKAAVDAATKEYTTALLARPDLWSSHYNLANYQLNRGKLPEAVESYGTALGLEPRAVLALVNQSMAYARMGDAAKSGAALAKALEVNPANAAANFNMGLLQAEQGDRQRAEAHLKKALEADPQMAQAAHNLCVMLSRDRPEEALRYCEQAAQLRPGEPRYAYTLAFFQQQQGKAREAASTLANLITRHPAYPDAYMLLGTVYESQGKRADAARVYTAALNTPGLPEAATARIKERLNRVKD